jgi:hypothetical protein
VVFAIGTQNFIVSSTLPTLDNKAWRDHTDQFWAQRTGTTLWIADTDDDKEETTTP